MNIKSSFWAIAACMVISCSPSATPDPGPNPGPQPGPTPDEKVAVTAVSLNQTSISIETGDSYTLVPTVLPSNATDPAVTWTSDNPGVASVNAGTVTAVAAGTAKITAKAGEKSAVCKVTVTEKTVVVESVTLNCTQTNVNLGDTLVITATVLPENAVDKTVIWETSDSTKATVKDGVVTALAAGFVQISATAGGVTATCGITVIDNRDLPVDQNGNVIYPDDDYGTFN